MTERTREFGIRLALGAIPKNILAIVVKQTFRVAAVGLAIGLVSRDRPHAFSERSALRRSPLDVATFATREPAASGRDAGRVLVAGAQGIVGGSDAHAERGVVASLLPL